jgi:Domain of unknown function (DUF4349)
MAVQGRGVIARWTRIAVPVVAGLLLVACGQGGVGGESGTVHAIHARAAEAEGAMAPRTLAYEHQVQLRVAADKVAAAADKVRAACAAVPERGCTVMGSRVNTGDYASAEVTVRAVPTGIQSVRAALPSEGEITGQSTTAEDLATPLTDNAKKLQMLQAYRTNLEALRNRAAADVDSLIKVNQQLAEVQSELESLAGEQAHLQKRVDTELLTVTISSVGSRSLWRPIADAVGEAGGNVAQGTANVITALTFSLPWLVVLVALVWAWRRWRGRTRRQP